MPKEITHWIIAEKAFENLPPDTRIGRIIRDYRHVYLAGAVVPDTPFYVRAGKWADLFFHLGESFHDQTGNSFTPLIRMLDGPTPPKPHEIAFILGVIAHIFADAAFHPMVFYFSGDVFSTSSKIKKSAGARHHRIESRLDLYLERKTAPPLRRMSDVMNNLEISQDALTEMACGLFGAGGTAVVRRPMRMALTAHSLIQKEFDRPVLKYAASLLRRTPFFIFDKFLSCVYPHIRATNLSGLDGVMPYVHPVTGQFLKSTVMEVTSHTARDLSNFFQTMERHLTSGTLPCCLRHRPGPNLHTGMLHTRKNQMRYFNIEDFFL